MVFAGNRRAGGVNSGLGGAGTLSLSDAVAIAREVPDVVAVSPEVSTTAQAISNGRNWSTTIAGESPDYLKIRDWKLASGAMFSEREVRAVAKVAVIGSKTANQLFGPVNPIGQTVRVKIFRSSLLASWLARGRAWAEAIRTTGLSSPTPQP